MTTITQAAGMRGDASSTAGYLNRNCDTYGHSWEC
jgi:hypothetical protein